MTTQDLRSALHRHGGTEPDPIDSARQQQKSETSQRTGRHAGDQDRADTRRPPREEPRPGAYDLDAEERHSTDALDGEADIYDDVDPGVQGIPGEPLGRRVARDGDHGCRQHGRHHQSRRTPDQGRQNNEEPPPRGEREHPSQGYHEEVQDRA